MSEARDDYEICVPHRFGLGRYLAMTFPAYGELLLRDVKRERSLAITAELRGTPVGLALVEYPPGLDPTLASVYVAPRHRGRNLATRLLAAIERAGVARGWPRLRIKFGGRGASAPALRRVLAKRDWPEPELRSHLLRGMCAAILDAPWMHRRRPFPAGFEIFPWVALADHEREALCARRQATGWPPIDVFPFRFGEACEPQTSLGLRFAGEVVGWVVNHRIDEKTLRFSCSYLREDLQKLGRLVEAYACSIEKMEAAGFEVATMVIPVEFPRMVAFARRHLEPFAFATGEVFGSAKQLSSTSANAPERPGS